MKYKVTCDNCNSSFVIEAEEGQLIECTCPHCAGVMTIPIPRVSQGEEYDPDKVVVPQTDNPTAIYKKKNNKYKYIVLIFIFLLIVLLSIAYFILSAPSNNIDPTPENIVTDTIPYEDESKDTVAPTPPSIIEDTERIALPEPKAVEPVKKDTLRRKKIKTENNDSIKNKV